MNWYYLTEENEVVGPVSEEALRAMLESGSLSPASQVCREGTEEWATLSEVFGGYIRQRQQQAQSRDMPAGAPQDGSASDSKTLPRRWKRTLFGTLGGLLAIILCIFLLASYFRDEGNSAEILARYLSEEGVPQDPKRAFDWYRNAAEKGDLEAQNALALMYEAGVGVQSNNDGSSSI